MKFKDLEYFQQLAKLKSYTKTAAFFQVKQPTITYAVKRLEEEVQTELLVRNQSHAQIQLTPAGKILAKHAQNILKELALAKLEINHLQEVQVRLGLPPIIGNFYFPKVSKALAAQQLLAKLEISNSGSQELYQALLKGQLDLAIVGMMNPLYDDQIEILPIAQKQFKIVVGRHHPLAKQKSVDFSELVEEKFVVLNEQYIHPKAMQKLAKQAGFTPKVIYQNSDLNILKGMIKEGVGIGFLVEIAVDEQKDELVCLEIADKNQPSFHISLLSRKNQPASVSQQVVQQILEENLLS